MLIWVAGQAEPIVLESQVAYGICLLMTPGARPVLRRLDDDCQREAWEAQHGA